MSDKKLHLSCADCGVGNCIHEKGPFPDFCLSKGMDEDLLGEAMAEYEKPEIRKAAITAADVETENYCQMTRLEETIEFAKKMGFNKIGIATCAGLLSETNTAAKVFRSHGFEVVGIACKCGTQKKADIGITNIKEITGYNICNPILQAKFLNKEKTELNVLIGLCVGHDSLFYKYSEALVTTLVSKDRVLGHNTVAALYQAEKYYKNKLFPADAK